MRVVVKSVVAASAAAAAVTLAAPPASAQLTSYSLYTGPTPDGFGLQISYNVTSDKPPITCNWSAKDLDQFGNVKAGAKVYNSTTASFSITLGPYPVGHTVQVNVACRDRSGDSAFNNGTFPITGEPS